VDEYRERSCVLGKPIYVLKNDGKKEARAVEINEQGNLTVEYADGERETLRAGEISVRARPGL
jgi:BirA family biotin operon repressor/biotin-[acetyl-CoA-carboxylase] ligase